VEQWKERESEERRKILRSDTFDETLNFGMRNCRLDSSECDLQDSGLFLITLVRFDSLLAVYFVCCK
jgi:hypothetical protein